MAPGGVSTSTTRATEQPRNARSSIACCTSANRCRRFVLARRRTYGSGPTNATGRAPSPSRSSTTGGFGSDRSVIRGVAHLRVTTLTKRHVVVSGSEWSFDSGRRTRRSSGGRSRRDARACAGRAARPKNVLASSASSRRGDLQPHGAGLTTTSGSTSATDSRPRTSGPGEGRCSRPSSSQGMAPRERDRREARPRPGDEERREGARQHAGGCALLLREPVVVERYLTGSTIDDFRRKTSWPARLRADERPLLRLLRADRRR